jgi:hemoglobin-like flavoprotein
MTSTGHTPPVDVDTASGPAAVAPALDINALERSFDLIAPHAEQVVETFYTDLFTRAPELRGLFRDIDRQRRSLLATLGVLRESLRDLPGIAPQLRGLGARHVRYGASPEHYPVVIQLLVAAMAEAGGDRWTSSDTTEWESALAVVTAEMLAGAADEPGARPAPRA